MNTIQGAKKTKIFFFLAMDICLYMLGKHYYSFLKAVFTLGSYKDRSHKDNSEFACIMAKWKLEQPCVFALIFSCSLEKQYRW